MTVPFPCPACGFLVFGEPPGSYDVCPLCAWEDDAVQLEAPGYAGGANRDSLYDHQRRVALRLAPVGVTVLRGYRRAPDWRPATRDEALSVLPAVHRDLDDETIYYWRRAARVEPSDGDRVAASEIEIVEALRTFAGDLLTETRHEPFVRALLTAPLGAWHLVADVCRLPDALDAVAGEFFAAALPAPGADADPAYRTIVFLCRDPTFELVAPYNAATLGRPRLTVHRGGGAP